MGLDGWQSAKLGDVVTIKHGWPFKSELFSEELTGSPIVVNIGNFEYTGGFRFETTTLKEYRGDYPAEFELVPGDTLLVMTCQTPDGEILGIPGRIPDDGRVYLHNQRMGKVVITRPDLVCADFLYWLFLWKDFNQELVATASGTKIVHTAPSRIEAFRFDLPSKPEQEKIAHILGALDDKIELNRRMNRTLEAMAATLFKSWFVDFDPVTAKVEGRQPYGMNAETAALFPSAFQDSELGPIPQGWRVGTVGEEFNLTMGQSPPGQTYNEIGDGIAFYQGRTDFGFRYPTPRVYCTAPTRFASAGDSLVSVRAPVGDVNMASERCAIGRGLAAIRHKSGGRSYTYYAMRSLGDEFAVFEGEGTLFGSISGAGFRNIKIVVPDPQVNFEYERKVHPIDQHIENNERQSITLAAIRDALLPKLLSGEIRVK